MTASATITYYATVPILSAAKISPKFHAGIMIMTPSGGIWRKSDKREAKDRCSEAPQ
jgi:hypothetical protein